MKDTAGRREKEERGVGRLQKIRAGLAFARRLTTNITLKKLNIIA